jgi:hypothetical protein
LFRTIGPAAGSLPAGLRRLALFVQPASGPLPDSPKLALFCRSLLHVRFTITPFLQGTCPSHCSARNWLCLAQKRRARGRVPGVSLLIPVQIGFVSHDLPPGNADLRIGIRAKLGLLVQPPPGRPEGRRAREEPPGGNAGNWLCFFEPIRRLNTTQLFSCKRLSFDFAPTEIGFVSHESPGDRGAASGPRSLTPDRRTPIPVRMAFVLHFKLHTSNLKLLPNWLCLTQSRPGGWAKARSFAPTSRRGRRRGRPLLKKTLLDARMLCKNQNHAEILSQCFLPANGTSDPVRPPAATKSYSRRDAETQRSEDRRQCTLESLVPPSRNILSF